jgi:hypothetical protein
MARPPDPRRILDPISLRAAYEQINAPAPNLSGWYYIFLWGIFQKHQGSGGTDEARRNQRVIIGSWIRPNITGSFPKLRMAAPGRLGRRSRREGQTGGLPGRTE